MVPKLQGEIHIPSHYAELELEFLTRDALFAFLRREELNFGDLAYQLVREAEENVGARATLPVNRDAPLRPYEMAVTCKPAVGYVSHLKAINIGGNHLIDGLKRELEPR